MADMFNPPTFCQTPLTSRSMRPLMLALDSGVTDPVCAPVQEVVYGPSAITGVPTETVPNLELVK